MSFSESLKLSVKEKANFTCCWCKDALGKVEVHHIIPRSEDGADDEDNAAPLCATCHSLFGANPELRKEIRGRRDSWYKRCTTYTLAELYALIEYKFNELSRNRAILRDIRRAPICPR